MPGNRVTTLENVEGRPRNHDLLAVRAGKGDEEAFDPLVRRHGSALLGLVTRMLGSRSEAEDAVQESFVTAWHKLPEFRGDAAFGTWMHRIVVHRCLNLLRSRRLARQWDSAGRAMPRPAHARDTVRRPSLGFQFSLSR